MASTIETHRPGPSPSAQTIQSRRLLRATSVAVVLGTSPKRVLDWARKDLIPCVRIGRNIRFDEEALLDWIAAGGTPTAGEGQ